MSFWVVGHDYCKTAADAGADYYSNSGANYHYETEPSPDASVPDASDASAADSGEDSAPDAASDAPPEDASGDSASSSDAASDASSDAADSAPACVSCGTTVTFFGNTSAFVSANGNPVTLMGGTVPVGNTLSAVTQTYPKGSATVHLVYATNASFTGATDVVMTYDINQPVPNNDQWYTVLPMQNAGTDGLLVRCRPPTVATPARTTLE